MPIEILKLTTAAQENDFFRLPFLIYKNHKSWIAPLTIDVKLVFEPEKNPFFESGACSRWLAYQNGLCVGRVAAFVSAELRQSGEPPVGGIGFFECVNDPEIALLLLNTAQNYLVAEGMQAAHAPINFGKNDRFWGLLTQNFDDPPTYLSNYNPAYYQAFFEAFGFTTLYNQISFKRNLSQPMHAAVHLRAERIAQNPRYKLVQPAPKELKNFAAHFQKIYNQAWVTHQNFVPLTDKLVDDLLKKIKPIADKNLTTFVFFENEPIAFFVSLPDINEQFRFLGGRFGWLQKIFFGLHRTLIGNQNAVGFVFGIAPAHQNKGLESYMFTETERIVKQKSPRYKHIYICWIGDFNTKMLKIMHFIGAKPYRTHTTFKKSF